MAIIKLGELIVGIRGTVGGVVFSANKSSDYARLWAMPKNPRTPDQIVTRTKLSMCRDLWLALSDEEREAWNIFAADPAQELYNSLGLPYYISGFGWFCKIQTRLMLAGLYTLTLPPELPKPTAPELTSITYRTVDATFVNTINFPAGAFGLDSAIITGYVLPGGAPTALYSARLRVILRDTVVGELETAISIATQHVALWGYPGTGWNQWLAVHRETHEGYRGAPTILSATYPTG